MRTFLTFIAVALVTALTVGLVAPPLVDWSARRQIVAHAIALRVGAPVEIDGPVTLRLLPTPYLDLADVKFGPPRDPWLQGRHMRFEFGLFSLFGGRIRLDDVTFDHPVLHLAGSLAPPDGGRFEFAHVEAHHGELSVARAGAAPLVLHDLAFEGSADTARGPYRGSGDFALDGGRRATFALASEPFAGDALPIKADIASGPARIDFDGRVVFGAKPALAGAATLTGEAPTPEGGVWPWRASGDLTLSGDAAEMSAADFRLGPDARAIEASGRVRLGLGAAPSLAAELTAKSLNLDSLLRREKEPYAPPSRAFAAFASVAGGALGRGAPLKAFSLKLAAGSAFLGTRPLESPTLSLDGAPGGALKLKLATGMPGHSRVDFDGALELGAAPLAHGRGGAEVGDFAPLAAWLGEDSPELAARLKGLQAALPNGAISARADLEISPDGFSARALDATVAKSRFTGGLVWRAAAADRRARLYLDLASDALDVDVTPNVEAGLDWLGDADLDFSLKADALRVARVGLAAVQGGSLDVKARKDGAKFTLERLTIGDLGGATISAEGETSPAGRWARVKLDAGRLGDFAGLVARAAPNAATSWLLRHADDLGAAKATFEARRDGAAFASGFPLDFLKADGQVGGSRFALTLSRAPAPVDAIAVQASLDAPDAGQLLRRLGARLAAGPAGRAELSLSGSGQWESGFDAKARLAFAGSEANWHGALTPAADLGSPWMTGPLALKSADLFPALAALGFGAAGAGTPAPIDLTFGLEAGATGGHASGIVGALAGAHVEGALDFAAPPTDAIDRLIAMAQNGDAETAVSAAPPPPAISGALGFDHASASALLSLALGKPGAARAGGAWPETKFTDPLLTPPSTDIGVKIAALDFGFGAAKGFGGRLKLDRERLAVEDASAGVNGGLVRGRLSIRRDKATATLTGAAALSGVTLDRPALHARLDGGVDFAGTGATAAALVASLAGSGEIDAADVRLPRLDPEGLARAMTKIEAAAGPPPDEPKLAALVGAELDRAPLTLANLSAPLALSSGAFRFQVKSSPELSGVFDVSDLSLSVTARLVDPKVGPFWTGPPPSVEATVKGPLDGGVRRIDVSGLASGLASEALTRESDRIANFESDLRERAAFNRRFKAERFLARREAEIDAYEEDKSQQSLMRLYLGPYKQWAASHGVAEPRDAKTDAANPSGLY